MVYKELKIVWQAARRIRRGQDAERNLEFLEFLALEGDGVMMRRAALRQYIDLTGAATPAAGGALARD